MKKMNHTMTADAAPVETGATSLALKQRLPRVAVIFAYLFCVVYITLLSRSVSLNRSIHTELFKAWREWFSGDREVGRSVIENIVLFVPLGFLKASLSFADGKSRRKTAVVTLLLGLLVSLGIEIMQYRSGRGWFDVDDLFNNVLGTLLGLLAAQLAFAVLDQKKRAGRLILFGFLPAVMLISGVLGCWLMRDMVSATNNLHADQFWFSVDSVRADGFSGRCLLYDQPKSTYRLFLVRGSKKREVNVVIRRGEEFIAKAEPTEQKYELQVQFSGYPLMSTGVYWNRGVLSYTPDDVREPSGADGQPLLPKATLKAYSEEWDCYVYQSGTELIWLIGSKVAPDAELICQLQTNEPERLPDNRIPYGFDNLGFLASEAETTIGAYRSFTRGIPSDYNVTSITVGLNTDGKVVWNSAFRP